MSVSEDQSPLLSPDESQLFAAIHLLQPATYNLLVSRLHLPVNAIKAGLATLLARGLIAATETIPFYYSTAPVYIAIAHYVEILLGPVLEENIHLRSMHDEFQAQCNQLLLRIRELEGQLK